MARTKDELQELIQGWRDEIEILEFYLTQPGLAAKDITATKADITSAQVALKAALAEHDAL